MSCMWCTVMLSADKINITKSFFFQCLLTNHVCVFVCTESVCLQLMCSVCLQRCGNIYWTETADSDLCSVFPSESHVDRGECSL